MERSAGVVEVVRNGGAGLRQVEEVGVANIGGLPGRKAVDESGDFEVGVGLTGGVQDGLAGLGWLRLRSKKGSRDHGGA